ncbi:citrate synthase [Campylobacter canadensis]|uniref:Citrate synthase n=1 Tax=Campylobacter canadensis TaxID=449520 RepID=A0ABS7WSY4_9BACT|nr:citrate synthase [Campylobacter canadensis]MBZ7987896.1 citrate synthase [Campylobacter canadensis]MBZ7995346.1 citrate synthase [Campylobacter canadensis]MBZ7996328.1 citrate synthase [Campylobacter canadensis]MBZ7998360.1 citrate synthase [Campylobacter canadensis]MBZ8000075.1 citrate synthase [Campylobacter canadensis]
MTNKAKLSYDGKEYEFDVLEGTRGPKVINMSSLYSQTGMFALDEGLTSTATCKSEITYINGEAGELRHRGYEIEWLAENKTFLDVVHLLLYKELPSKERLDAFRYELKKRSFIHEGMHKLFDAFPDDAHPMAIMQASVAALSTFYPDHLNMDKHEDYMEMAARIIAKIPTIAASAYRYKHGYPMAYPNLDRGFTENFLYMLRTYPYDHVELRPIEVKALDTVFMLHADHEQNASTSVVRSVGSTHAHPYSCISSAIGALWGHAHGGANEGVIRMLEMIATPDRVDEFIKRAKDKNDPFRLMGFGHRVYKNFDPRAKVLKKLRDQLVDEIGIDANFMKVAQRIEDIALNDEYFVSRGLYPNVDFHSGLILKALGIPNEMFAVLFVIGRIPGWISQLVEQKEAPLKIVRPRQLYVGK